MTTFYDQTSKATSKVKVQSERTNDLFPFFPQQRENTITSAPSLIVLVLKPFPSDQIA